MAGIKDLFRNNIAGRLAVVALIVLIVEGLACKLLVSLSSRLNSDSANGGLVALEFWKHHNYLLSGYYLPSTDPYFFTDLVPFHLVLQGITGFDPEILRLTGFIVFCGSLIVFSYLVYRITNKSLPAALTFAALLANMNTPAYDGVLGSVLVHNGTLLFTGILFLLVLGLRNAGVFRLAFTAVLLALVVLSDSIAIAWFLLPFLAAYFLMYRDRTRRLDAWVISWTLLAGLVTFVKTLFIDYLVPPPLGGQGIGSIPLNAFGFFRELSWYPSASLYNLLAGKSDLLPVDLALGLVFLAVFGIALWKTVHATDRTTRSFALIMGASAAIMFLGVTFTSWSEATTRYLGFTAVSVFMLLSIFVDTKDRLYLALIAILLVSGAVSGVIAVASLDHPNEKEYQLIDYLKSNNITFAYADYWDADLLTYLSGEQVIVRPVDFGDDGFIPHEWVTCARWFDERPSEYYIIANQDNPAPNKPDGFVAVHTPDSVSYFGNYTLYHFSGQNAASVYAAWYLDKGSGWQRFSHKFLGTAA